MHDGVSRRVRPATPPAHASFEASLDGLPLSNVDIPLDNVLRLGASRLETEFYILEDLFGLGCHIAFSHQSSGGIDRRLGPDIYSLHRTTRHDCLRKSGAFGQAFGIEVLHG